MTGTPQEIVAALDAAAAHVATPCGEGTMLWRRWGSGPALVLLHGGHGSWTHWIRNVPALARSRTVFAADLPGEGASAIPPEPIGLETISAAVEEGLLRAIPGDERFDLAGFSFGGLIGGIVAGRLGARVRNLILVGTAGLGLMQRDRPLKSLRGLTDPAEVDAVHRYNLAAMLFAKAENVDDLAVHVHAENIRQCRIKGHPFGGIERLRAELPRAAARVHAIWGDRDVTAGSRIPEYGAFLASLRPPASLHLIPEIGHWAAYEAADRFNQLLLSLTGA